MRFFKLLFKIVFVLVVLLLIGGYIFIRTFDLNKYKPLIAQITEEQIGRKLAINGDAKLGISLIPTLVLNDVELQNADWASAPFMVKVEQIEIKLSVLPLLKKQIEIDNVTILKPQINLEVAKNGLNNWTFEKPDAQTAAQNVEQAAQKAVESGLVDEKTAQKTAEMVKNNPESALLGGFAAQHVSIENGTLIYVDGQSGSTTEVVLNSFNLKAPTMDSMIDVDFDALVNGQKINGTASVGSLNALLGNKPNYPVKANVSAYGVNAQVSGVLNGIMSGDIAFDLATKVYNPEGNFSAPKVNLSTQAKGNLKAVTLANLVVDVNGNVITGQVKADISGKLPFVDATLNSDKIDVATLMPQPKAAFALPAIIASAQASELLPNDKIPYEFLNYANAKALLNVKSLIVNSDLSLQNVMLSASLNNGALTINPLTTELGGGKLDVNASVNAKAQTVALKLNGANIILQKLYTPLAVQPNSSNFGFLDGGVLDLDIDLASKGATVRQLGDSLNGQVIVIAGKSTVQTGKLQILSGNFVTQILQALRLDKNVDKNINMNCAVVRSDVKNGVFTFPKGIAFNGKKLNLVSDGKLDLNNDKIDFTIHPYSGEVIDVNIAQAIASFLKVKGTLQAPKIVLDDAQAIRALVGVAATGGATYLGSQLLLDNDSSPCYTALKGTPYATRFPAPSATNQATQAVYQGASDAVNGGIDAVKDTAKFTEDGVKDTVNGLKDAAKGLFNSLKRQ